MIKAIIFDMDGVIVNSKKQDFLAWKKTFSDYEYNLNYKKYLSLLGMTVEEIIRENINSKITKENTSKIVNKIEKYFIDEIRKNKLKTICGLKKFLIKIKKTKYKIGLGTSAPICKVNIILENLNVKHFFNNIITAEEVEKGKPNPEIFLKVAKKLKVNPQECIVIEDAPKGIKAAKNAGMKCIAITTTHKKKDLIEADRIINSFNEINSKLIKKLY